MLLNQKTRSFIPVVLAGGTGSRLWPLSRERYPKQFLSLMGIGETMLQSTLGRSGRLLGNQSPVVICNEEHRFLVAEQLRAMNAEFGSLGGQIVLESTGRNTAPAIALAAYAALSRNGFDADPLLLVLPADHVITDESGFQRAFADALPLAAAGRLVTFGVVPNGPESGYGYIVPGRNGVISRFLEKPEISVATELIDKGALWNSGMFFFSARSYLAALARHAPDISTVCELAWKSSKIDSDFIRPDAAIFDACRSDSIDYAVMEKFDGAAVVALDAGWSDVGSWSSLHEVLPRDDLGNSLRGDVIVEDTVNSLVISESRLVATVGLKDHVVIETKDAVLVAPSERMQDIKTVVARLKAEGRSEHKLHREVHRPWGSYDSIEVGVGYQVKKIILKRGAAISLQLHHQRSEHWIVVAGHARVTRGEEIFHLEANQSTYIPAGTKHRLENTGSEFLQIIEIQSGAYLGEDDIVRFDDRYGRGSAVQCE